MLKTEMKMKTDPDVEISQLYAVPKNWKLQLSIPTSRFSIGTPGKFYPKCDFARGIRGITTGDLSQAVFLCGHQQ